MTTPSSPSVPQPPAERFLQNRDQAERAYQYPPTQQRNQQYQQHPLQQHDWRLSRDEFRANQELTSPGPSSPAFPSTVGQHQVEHSGQVQPFGSSSPPQSPRSPPPGYIVHSSPPRYGELPGSGYYADVRQETQAPGQMEYSDPLHDHRSQLRETLGGGGGGGRRGQEDDYLFQSGQFNVETGGRSQRKIIYEDEESQTRGEWRSTLKELAELCPCICCCCFFFTTM